MLPNTPALVETSESLPFLSMASLNLWFSNVKLYGRDSMTYMPMHISAYTLRDHVLRFQRHDVRRII